ncbi:MAG: NUDIX domain-containing protein [Nanoarchaeota archaeon]|jgi:predicted metal-dependent phosphoesterase TrpH/8-oxo-dGTP pyrophosphatase MutT (NUDIX family)|nr:NUDIX domain-containing protein [Nanoarchaeota archaeon]
MIYDLHTHTTASDGKLSPTELVDYAIKKGLPGIAITDHNTVTGTQEALEHSRDKPIEIISGIEISCDCENKVKEVHIVGLFIDHTNPEIKKIKETNKEKGKIVAKEIIEKLKQLNYEIAFSDLEKRGHFGKPIIAELLLEKYPNDFENRKDVFNKLLGWGQPAMVYGKGLSIEETIKIIQKTGGLAILAHPGQLREYDDYFIDKFIKLGGDGIEVDNTYNYLDNAEELREKYRNICKTNNLIASAGTDFHEVKDYSDLGDRGVNEQEFLKIRHKLRYKKVKSVGAIIHNDNKFLIVKKTAANKGHWDFPKGGIKNKETDEMHALHREIKEETNLEIEVQPNFYEELHYKYINKKHDYDKTVGYYLAKPKTKTFETKSNDPEEIEECLWATKEEVYKKIKFEDSLEIFNRALEQLKLSI